MSGAPHFTLKQLHKRRRLIGLTEQFALNEASYTTIRLLQEFEAIQSRDARPWQEWLTLTCTGFTGCKVGLTQRI